MLVSRHCDRYQFIEIDRDDEPTMKFEDKAVAPIQPSVDDMKVKLGQAWYLL